MCDVWFPDAVERVWTRELPSGIASVVVRIADVVVRIVSIVIGIL